MAPSGVQKERMMPSDMYVLDRKGDVVEEPVARPPPNRPPKLSECSPLFLSVSGKSHSLAFNLSPSSHPLIPTGCMIRARHCTATAV